MNKQIKPATVENAAVKPATKLSDHRYLITSIMLITSAIFLWRSVSSTFFKTQPESPTSLELANVATTGSGLNEFLSVTGYSLGSNEFMHTYKEGHRNRGTFIDIYIPMNVENTQQQQKFNCLLKVKISTTRDGGGEKVHEENRRLIKSLPKRSSLAGTFHRATKLPSGLYDTFPELKGDEENTLVLHYGTRPKNYFLMDCFWTALCLGSSVMTFASWMAWSPDSIAGPNDGPNFGAEYLTR